MTDERPLVATYFAPGQFPDGTGTVLDKVTTLAAAPDFRSAGSVTLEQLNTAATKPAKGGVVAVDVRGFDGNLTRVCAARCTTRTVQTLASNSDGTRNEAAERTTWEMPGHLQVLSKGPITPTRYVGLWPKMQTIAFNWAHPDYDQSAWTPATSMSTIADAKSGQANEWGTLSPNGPWAWSDDWAETNALAADIIGPDDGSVTNVSNPSAPNQEHYFRQVISISSAGAYRMAVSADNKGEFYVDGVLIGTFDDWLHLTFFDVDLTAGFHVVAVHLTNYPVALANPCGYSWALYRAGGGFVEKSQAANTVHVEYQAEPPGMTWGQAWILALQPYIDAGKSWALALGRSFDADVDSNGDPWAILGNITAQVGRDTLYTFWQKGQQSYMDGWMDENGWTLHAYNPGTFTPASGFVMEVGNLTSLTHKTEEEVADELLVDSELGVWLTVGGGETVGFVSMGTEVALGDIDTRGQAIIDILGDEREEITGGYQPRDDTEIPYVNPDFRPGSIGSAPRLNGSQTDERLLSPKFTYSESAPMLQIELTFKDRIQERDERILTALEST